MRGLTLPHYDALPDGPLYLAEGASDTATLHSVGALAFGRASAGGSAAERLWLARLLRKHWGRRIVVVGDRDWGAGPKGADSLAGHLAEALGRSVSWALPRKGFKDVREQVVAGKWKRGFSVQEAKA